MLNFMKKSEDFNQVIQLLAKKQIDDYVHKILALGYTQIKVGFEMEFMAFARQGNLGAEILDTDEIEKKLKKAFPTRIEKFLKEWPIGFTEDDKGFEFPGVRKYEVVFTPDSPQEICAIAYSVKDFFNKLAKELHVDINYHSKPIKNEEMESYIEAIKRKGGFPEEIDESKIVKQGTGISAQYNISLWRQDVNAFFNPQTKDGTSLFYAAAFGLLTLTHESLLPFICEPNALLRLTPLDTETAAPGAVKIAVRKGGEFGKGIIRPSPFPDEILAKNSDYLLINTERRSNETFRMEIRHNDPMQNFYVSMAATLAGIYYGIVNSKLSITEIKKINFPFEKKFQNAIESFKHSTLWKTTLGIDLYNTILTRAEKIWTCHLTEEYSLKLAQPQEIGQTIGVSQTCVFTPLESVMKKSKAFSEDLVAPKAVIQSSVRPTAS